jgi:plasmid stability protein
MASLLITDLDETLHRRLQASATLHHRGLEEEVRELLRTALARQQKPPREFRWSPSADRAYRHAAGSRNADGQ